MEHAEALERIEIAAVEPEGLDRLMAGDTPDAAAVAGHLAGCPSCADELVRIRRIVDGRTRRSCSAEPDPELRERTLAFVKAVGRDRTGAAVGVSPYPDRRGGPSTISVAAGAGPPRSVRRPRRAARTGAARPGGPRRRGRARHRGRRAAMSPGAPRTREHDGQRERGRDPRATPP